jgi:hypothetical protein
VGSVGWLWFSDLGIRVVPAVHRAVVYLDPVLFKFHHSDHVCQEALDCAWDSFVTPLEQVLRRAHSEACTAYGSSAHDRMSRRKGLKGQVKLVRTATRAGTRQEPGSTFRERRIRKAVNRLQEMVRLEAAGRRHTPEYGLLAAQVSRVLDLPPGTTDAKLHLARAQLEQHGKDEHTQRLACWRRRLRESERECFNWVKGAKVVPTANVRSSKVPELGTSTTTQSALEVLAAHWTQVWERPASWRGHVQQVLAPSPTLEEEQWPSLTGADLLATVPKLRGKAASTDGWGGSEVAELPAEVLACAARLFALCETSGRTPTQWHQARQVHLPKAETDASGVQAAEKLRPVTILSTWYRLMGSARLRKKETRVWLEKWWPAQATGGKAGGGVHDALAVLADAALADEGFMVSLDYSLAFDMLDPGLADLQLRQAGLPAGFAGVLRSVWQDQHRLLQYGGLTHPRPVRVTTSLPQGDPWSLVAMVLALAGPTADICARYPRTVLRTFVDDRTFVAPSAQEAREVEEAWGAWSERLALQENSAKASYFHCSAEGCRQLRRAGAPAAKVTQAPEVLGVHFRGRQRRRNTSKEEARLAEACRLIRRCALLPVSWRQKQTVIATQGLGKATWGWMLRNPPKADGNKVERAVRAGLREGPNASVPLRAILRGHSLSFQFRTLSAAWTAAAKQAACRVGLGEPCRWSRLGWPQVLCQSLSALGWTNMGPWEWHHERLGLQVGLKGRLLARGLQAQLHDLRESWRASNFWQFMGENRRDAAECRSAFAQYQSARFARVRRACTAFQAFQVLSGATMSPAALRRHSSSDAGLCEACQQAAPTLRHLLWECPASATERPQVPQGRGVGGGLDALQSRLGWPAGAPWDSEVLQWHQLVRDRVLRARYG